MGKQKTEEGPFFAKWKIQVNCWFLAAILAVYVCLWLCAHVKAVVTWTFDWGNKTWGLSSFGIFFVSLSNFLIGRQILTWCRNGEWKENFKILATIMSIFCDNKRYLTCQLSCCASASTAACWGVSFMNIIITIFSSCLSLESNKSLAFSNWIFMKPLHISRYASKEITTDFLIAEQKMTSNTDPLKTLDFRIH